MKLRLLGHYRLTGLLELVTGLHIGRGRDDLEMSGKDNPLALAPDGQPYIPGSTLKGKLRALLEWDTGVQPEGQVRGARGRYEADDPVLRIFGVPAGEGRDAERPALGPTRLLLSDAWLATDADGAARDWRRTFLEGAWRTEEKAETRLNRITAEAAPRSIERIPSGVQFAFAFRYRLFDVDGDGGKADRDNFRWVLKALVLLEDDALGGGGSRGSGRIRIAGLKVEDSQSQAVAVSLADVRKDPPKWSAPEYRA